MAPTILQNALSELSVHGMQLPMHFTLYVPPIESLQLEAKEIREALTGNLPLDKRA